MNHIRQLCTLPAALAALFLTGTLHAQVPPLINYQGRVAVDGVNFDGAGQFRFALVNPDASETYWSNDGASIAGSEPATAVPLTVTKGLYSVLLGDTSLGAGMTDIPGTVFTNPDVRLRVWFDDGVNGSQLLEPDQRIAPAPYLADGVVKTASIAPGAVTGASIAAGSIDATHIAPGSLDFSVLTVPVAPGPGQVLGFDGATLNWVAPGGGVFALNGTRAYYNGGNVGIGTATPPIKFTVQTNPFLGINSPYGIEHTDGTVRLTTYLDGSSGQLGTRTNHPLSLFVNDGLPSITIDTGGATTMAPIGSAGSVTFGSPNGENGMSIVRAGNRADVRFEGTTLKMVVGPVGGPPASTRGIAVTAAGNVGIGTTNPSRTLEVFGDFWVRDASVRVLTIRGGADLAEPFAMSHADIEPGTVVVIDAKNPGQLRKSAAAYDKKVAGIVSGANGINPGISMIDEQQLEAGENVALSGRVYVKANTSAGTIGPGDFLTTSDIPGEAMKAADHQRAQGSILGKAMTPLDGAAGMVLVLVTLQ